MEKTKEELNELKKEYESVTSKLSELTEEELKHVTGGGGNKALLPPVYVPGNDYNEYLEAVRKYNEEMKKLFESHNN